MFENTEKIIKNKKKRITRILSAINIIVIILTIAAGAFYLLVFKRETVSNEENRNLTKFPKFSASSYFSGKFTAGVADYYDDTVHGRSDIKAFISSYILPLKGRQYGDDGIVIIGQTYSKEDNTIPSTEPASTAPPTTETVSDNTVTTAVTEPETTTTTATTIPDNKNPEANGEISDGIVIVNDRGVMLFGGGMKGGIDYAESLNKYKEDLGDDVNVYSLVCPTPVSYYLPENYQNLTASEKDNIDNINSALVNVTPVDAYTALLFHKQENIYSRTDHHWQPLGAYYAAEEFARVAGVDFAPLSEYKEHILEGYVGTLYGYTKSSALLNNPEQFIYYEPTAPMTVTRYDTTFSNPAESSTLLLDPSHMSNSSYYMVFGGDKQITHVNTSCKNGRNLVIFKDSYGNALLPALTSSFENIYLCDVRYFDINAVKFCKEVEATDLLFAMCTFSAVGVNNDNLEPNRTR